MSLFKITRAQLKKKLFVVKLLGIVLWSCYKILGGLESWTLSKAQEVQNADFN